MIERVYNNNCNIQGAISKVAFLYLYYSMWHLYLIKYYSVSPRFGDVVLFVIVTTLFSVHVIYGCIHVASLGRIYFKSIAFLFFISILSAFLSANYSEVAFIVGVRDFFSPILLSLIMAMSPPDTFTYRKLCGNLVIISLLMLLAAAVGFNYPELNLTVVHTSESGPPSLRIGLGFTNPNTLAYISLICMLYFLSRAYYNYSHWLLVIIIALFGVIVLTTSRSAFAVAFFFILALIFRYVMLSGVKNTLKLILLVGVTVITIYLLFFLSVIEIPDNLRITRLESIERIMFIKARVEIWNGVVNDYYEDRSVAQWMFGNGPGSVTRINASEGGWRVVDSSWLKILTELGIAGLAGIFVIMLRLVRLGVKFVGSPFVEEKIFGLAFVMIMMSIFMFGFVSSILDVYPVNYFVFFLFGYMVNAHASRKWR